MTVRYAVEGDTDAPVAERIIASVKRVPLQTLVAGGKSRLDPKLPGYNVAASLSPWLVLRDLDTDAACAGELVRILLNGATLATGMALRVPVRSVEAWLLADHDGLARFFALRVGGLPQHPDTLDQPKRALIDLCRGSRSRQVRDGMVPRIGSGRDVGPLYVALVSEFARDHWDLERARVVSPSLERALSHVDRLVAGGAW